MPESLHISENLSKEQIYGELLPQIKSLVQDEKSVIANMANISAALKEVFKFWWVGFYLVDGDNDQELVLGPFQGPIACTRIKYGHGVCGSTWKARETIIVPDVDKFPGHIACSSFSKSEIVVPLFDRETKRVTGVLDVDSEHLNHFDEIDSKYLELICQLLNANNYTSSISAFNY